VAEKAQKIMPTDNKTVLDVEDDVENEKSFNLRVYLRETFVNDKIFWIAIVVLLLANIGFHRNITTGMWFGFIMASYSAIANDSI